MTVRVKLINTLKATHCELTLYIKLEFGLVALSDIVVLTNVISLLGARIF
jgi:hypothetical protein